MVRGYLIIGTALALSALSASAQTVPEAARPRPEPAAVPGTDPARDAAAPHGAKGKRKMARSSMSKLMPHHTTHDIMMPEPEAAPPTPPR